MANTEWEVTTEKLRTSAAAIQDKTTKYNAEYTKLYTELQNLRSNQWKGVASDAFNTKLEGYRDTFVELENVLKKFAEGLLSIAQNYEETEERIRSTAAQ